MDLPSIGALFAEVNQVGDRYLAPSRIKECDAVQTAIAKCW
ncbi:hypothetical protein [Leptolyngbya sp. FACHB-16]|nr:hypothetical protein [Leptolyngbya sp. FACHB-16]